MKKIKPVKRLFGAITLPGDKSISHRAVMIGAIASGETKAKGVLDCDDCNYTIKAFRKMGVSINKRGDCTVIEGKGLNGLKRPGVPIDVGNSGTSMRLLAGILSGQNFEVTIKGDSSLSKRPMERIVKPLSLMGVDIKSGAGGYPPIRIRGGKVMPIDYKLPVPSAQVKSAVLFAGLYGHGVTTVEEAFKSRDHTERMLKYFGANLKVKGLKVLVEGKKALKPRTLEIPGDISSASFFLAAAILLKGSKVRINKVGINPTRAGILNLLVRMGARVKILNKKNGFEPVGDISAEYGKTKGLVIEKDDIPGIIDELPIIFVLASLSEGQTIIKGAEELRVKETDRIESMKENLVKMGGRIYVNDDEIIIQGVKRLSGASLESFGDHRTCMAMTVAALAAEDESVMDEIECVNKSFPGFFRTLERLKRLGGDGC